MLITILTIYIIGVVVAYGLALGEQTVDEPIWPYEKERRFALVFCWGSWQSVLMLAGEQYIRYGRLCFQWRRKG